MAAGGAAACGAAGGTGAVGSSCAGSNVTCHAPSPMLLSFGVGSGSPANALFTQSASAPFAAAVGSAASRETESVAVGSDDGVAVTETATDDFAPAAPACR